MASNCITLPFLESDETRNSINSTEANKRMRGINKQYFFVEEFSSLDEAKNSIINEGCWRAGQIKPTKEGTKYFYVCKYAKTHGDPCAVGAYIIYLINKVFYN